MSVSNYAISVIICAYTEKRWNEVVASVASVQRQTLAAKDIIVVIDHNPALLQRVQEHLSNVVVIENSGEKGLSGARNSGWKIAQGEIIAFLDDDAIAEEDWLEHLVACYTDREIAGVGGRILPLWKACRPKWFPHEFHWVIGCSYRGLPTEGSMRIRNVIGANMSMRRSILETMGGFRKSFGCDKSTETAQGILKWFKHYAGDEETEFCIRVSQQMPDSAWLYATSAIVQHQVSPDRTRWGYFVWRCYDEGLGKASLVKLHNSSTALSSERAYTLKRSTERCCAWGSRYFLPPGARRSLACRSYYRWTHDNDSWLSGREYFVARNKCAMCYAPKSFLERGGEHDSADSAKRAVVCCCRSSRSTHGHSCTRNSLRAAIPRFVSLE